MKQYSVENQLIELKVKSPNLIVLIFFSFITVISIVLPITGVILNLAAGNGFHIGLFFGLAISGLIGFYLLRNTLWNIYGQETISFRENEVEYIADYGWFKDKVKSLPRETELQFEINPIGYDEDHKGVLIISTNDDSINCVTKMDIDELKELIELIQKELSK